jgi:hypothetical protein
VNSPASIGIASAIAARVSGSCSDAAWCAADSHTSDTRIRSSSSSTSETTYERHPTDANVSGERSRISTTAAR